MGAHLMHARLWDKLPSLMDNRHILCFCRRARDWVANSLNYTRPVTLSLFEANIRIVGGLLSAYDFSADRIFLQRAQELVDFMMPNFYESPLGKVCFLLPSPLIPTLSLPFVQPLWSCTSS